MRLFYLALLLSLLWPLQSAAQDKSALQQQSPPDAVASSDTAADNSTVPKADADRTLAAVAQKPDNAAGRPSAGLGLGKMALSLAIVVAIVLALGWTFKKLTLRLPGSRHIKIISSMPLGPKERLLVVEMQGKQRVLGVTAHSINLLFELENPLPEEKLASDFHTQLQSFLKK